MLEINSFKKAELTSPFFVLLNNAIDRAPRTSEANL